MTVTDYRIEADPPIPSSPITTLPVAALCEVSKTVRGVRILAGLSFSVEPQETLLISGASGSGKSTAMRMLEGIETPDSGEVYVLGQRIDALSGRQRRKAAQSIGLGFQDPLLDNALPVWENLVGLARINGRFDQRKPADVDRLSRIIDILGISKLLHTQAAVLSGGEKLRVALGRALACRPAVLMLDEPTHMVDAAGKVTIYNALREVIRQENLTAVVVSHDTEAKAIATREIVLDGGRATVSSSAMPYVAQESTDIPSPDEHYRVGRVEVEELTVGTLEIAPERLPRSVWRALVHDPYVEAYSPDELTAVRSFEMDVDEQARDRRLAGHWKRSPRRAYGHVAGAVRSPHVWGDPLSTAYYYEKMDSSAFSAWRDLIPSSRALLYPSDPTAFSSVSVGSRVVQIDARCRRYFSLAIDAIGIRSRASVMAWIVYQLLKDTDHREGDGPSPLYWLSVACGTALPAIKAAIHADAEPSLLLLDIDKDAMACATELASKLGYRGALRTRRLNIFNPKRMLALAEELRTSGAQPKLVDLMGIFEYTGSNLGVDPVEFLQAAYACLAPDGSLILGQMRADRPMPDLVMGASQWPYVEMRTLDELMAIIADAGIPPTVVDLYLPTDGVYAVGVIHKAAP